jgi:4-amino-4-deoxy-L-arabinose transferase-like glycosyltransferase
MIPHDPDPLLKELLAGDELASFRQTSLEQGLNALRRQQRRRRAGRGGALLLLPLLFAFAVLWHRSPATSNRQIASTNPMTAVIPTPPAVGRDPKFITDEELFALFPNRPLALVGKPGRQQLVFLDQPAKNRQP